MCTQVLPYCCYKLYKNVGTACLAQCEKLYLKLILYNKSLFLQIFLCSIATYLKKNSINFIKRIIAIFASNKRVLKSLHSKILLRKVANYLRNFIELTTKANEILHSWFQTKRA